LAEYEGGRAQYKGGDYSGALARFHRAAELSADPRLLWNMAACEQKLGQIGRMVELIERYLDSGGALLTEADRKLAVRLENSVRGRVAAVAVNTELDGVEIFVDGQHLATTPRGDHPIWVDAGSRHVRFTKAGFKDVERDETVEGGGSIAWSVTLEPEPPPPPPTPPAPAVAEAPAPAPNAKPPSRLPAVVLAGAGLVQLATAAIFVGVSTNKYVELEHDCSPACNPSSAHPWQAIGTAGDVLFITGGLALAAGVAWWVVLPGAKRKGSALWVAPFAGGVVLGAAL
jgi:hypothetical protein